MKHLAFLAREPPGHFSFPSRSSINNLKFIYERNHYYEKV